MCVCVCVRARGALVCVPVCAALVSVCVRTAATAPSNGVCLRVPMVCVPVCAALVCVCVRTAATLRPGAEPTARRPIRRFRPGSFWYPYAGAVLPWLAMTGVR